MARKIPVQLPTKPLPEVVASSKSKKEKLRKQAILTELIMFLAEEGHKTETKTTDTSATSEKHDDREAHEDEGDYCHPGEVVEDRFHVVAKIKEGGFGQIFKAIDERLHIDVALKFEEVEEKHPNMESHVLERFQGNPHCPKMYAKTTYPDCSFIAMQLLGKNLHDLRLQCSAKPPRFSISTCLRLTEQSLTAIEALHGIGYLHRDVKPANFCMSNESRTAHTLFMIDYGLARYFLTKDRKSVRPERQKVSFRGTVKYASLNTHLKKDMSRRDDLWSLFYSTYEMLIGNMPWKRLEDRDAVGKMKMDNTPEAMCQILPAEIAEIVALCRQLHYADKPQYSAMIGCLSRAMHRYGVRSADDFDWQVQNCVTKFGHMSVPQS